MNLEYQPWEVLDGPFEVLTPWAKPQLGLPVRAVILERCAFADASDIEGGLRAIAQARLLELRHHLDYQAVTEAFAAALVREYDGPLVHMECEACGNVDDVWVNDAGHIEDWRDLHCACGHNRPMRPRDEELST